MLNRKLTYLTFGLVVYASVASGQVDVAPAPSRDIFTEPTAEDIPALVKIIRTEGYYGAEKSPAATDALVKIGKPAIPPLVELLDEKGWIPRYKAVKILGLMGPVAEEALPALEKELKEKRQHFLLRKYTPLAIAAIKSDHQFLIDFIANRDNHKNPPHPRFAAVLLGRMGPKAKDAVPVLVDFAKKDGIRPSPVIKAIAQIDPDTARKVEIQTGVAFHDVECEGEYRHHLQGICTNDTDSIFWSFTTTLVKTDLHGKVAKQIEVANHHGDLCFHDGKLYVAVNLGQASTIQTAMPIHGSMFTTLTTLKELCPSTRLQEVFHGAGGIGKLERPLLSSWAVCLMDFQENYVYEYDGEFKFVKKHVVKSGHTHLGIQTATYAYGKWMFGCYGNPKTLLVTDANFNMVGRHEFDCSLGIVRFPGGILSAIGRCVDGKGCTGSAELAYYNTEAGMRLVRRAMLIEPARLEEKLNSRHLRIVDVRSEEEYAKGHVPGAVHVNVGDWKALAVAERGLRDSEGWAQRIEVLGINNNTHVVVYGSRVTNSARIWWLLKYVGVKDVSLINGGWDMWVGEDRPVDKSTPQVIPSTFTPKFQADRLAEIDSVKESLTSNGVKIVDTRSDDEFAGGRVPGSVHLEWKHLLAADGRFKTYRELKTLLYEQGILQADTAVCY